MKTMSDINRQAEGFLQVQGQALVGQLNYHYKLLIESSPHITNPSSVLKKDIITTPNPLLLSTPAYSHTHLIKAQGHFPPEIHLLYLYIII